MKIKQLSVYLQNEPGHLSNVCRILGEANIDILTLSLA
ncbi:MAG: amino acid-binding protein, partial [Planctomycetaceae bacterium]|nr:amino acid-binding protein [Planctomycetaceae bacterium]